MATRLLGRVLGLCLAACVTTPAHASDRYWQLQEVNRAVQSLPLTDCKASSFEAIARLRALGISAVFVAVLTEKGTGHAIAVVDGKWALDNRYQRVVSVDQLRRGGYTIAHLRGEP